MIEAVFEHKAVKQAMFARLDRLVKPGAVLATKTSALKVSEAASATARPEAVVDMHFFSPANVMLAVGAGQPDSADRILLWPSLAKSGFRRWLCAGTLRDQPMRRQPGPSRQVPEPQGRTAAGH